MACSSDEQDGVRYFPSLISRIKQRTGRESLLTFTHWRDQVMNGTEVATLVHSSAGSSDEQDGVRCFRSLISRIK
ncbi:hypothetical protein [Virgibacillus sp. YIM 98842]|uniref:hypothetical protein n=1 Tax=Virgibacillus sp. YIM 98842 TaxID=2663533 RepID=UPI0013DA5D70|nr:hypothetical protein [Virgibacillus sp. YIM 98842]